MDRDTPVLVLADEVGLQYYRLARIAAGPIVLRDGQPQYVSSPTAVGSRTATDDKVVQTARANPLDKFALGIRKMVEEFMVQRMADNDRIVTRYMDDQEFQNCAFPMLAQEIFAAVHARDQEAIQQGAGRT
jgi:type I restriction enzyme R subunit